MNSPPNPPAQGKPLLFVEQLKQDGASEDHIRDVESEIKQGATRYRRADVAGASASDDIPATFKEADQLAQIILAKLRAKNLFT